MKLMLVLDDPCASNPCNVVGVGLSCFLDTQSPYYTCSKCPPGYQGDGIICFHPHKNPCASNPCYTGVACIIEKDPPLHYRCGKCPSGLVGDGKKCVKEDDVCTKCPIDHKGGRKQCLTKLKDLSFVHDDKLYYLSRVMQTWEGTREYCQRQGADIPQVTKEPTSFRDKVANISFFRNALQPILTERRSIQTRMGRPKRLGVWLGASYNNKEKDWKWLSGRSVGMSPDFHWGPNEPNNNNNEGKDSAADQYCMSLSFVNGTKYYGADACNFAKRIFSLCETKYKILCDGV
ncbi:hypothetical protein Pcinc_020575 [Petrolisthes cinctipes]|uniref:C-type lectin domain-containing protein n=1 Tax=Petrolisthes cinctipes TaxID=88211 RepID=A0AAE1FIW8_PETCI|nr:hypothetical protein Pcinc_020575 [Petrolisthes cinctipes]